MFYLHFRDRLSYTYIVDRASHSQLSFPLNILLLTLAIVTWLSQYINTNGVGLIYKRISAKRFLSHLAIVRIMVILLFDSLSKD